MNFLIKERFAFIEHMVRWYGGVTANHISEIFGITRVNAHKVLKNYTTLHPKNLVYDKSLKKRIRE